MKIFALALLLTGCGHKPAPPAKASAVEYGPGICWVNNRLWRERKNGWCGVKDADDPRAQLGGIEFHDNFIITEPK